MFSGKTSELIRRVTRATIAKQKVVAFKPAVDDRHDGPHIFTHQGVFQDRQEFRALQVSCAKDILEASEAAKVVGIDEAQFFDEDLPEVVEKLARRGKRVVIAGLDLDYRGQPFGIVPELMAKADYIDKTYAICMVCGCRATRSQRVADSDETVLVGAEGAYQARCRTHWSPQPVLTRHANKDFAEG
jgi:thymidine kinase